MVMKANNKQKEKPIIKRYGSMFLSFFFFACSLAFFVLNGNKKLIAREEEPGKYPFIGNCLTRDSVVYAFKTICKGTGIECVPIDCPPPPYGE
jgi:hypothetical protein